jgi:hypothetical protein
MLLLAQRLLLVAPALLLVINNHHHHYGHLAMPTLRLVNKLPANKLPRVLILHHYRLQRLVVAL